MRYESVKRHEVRGGLSERRLGLLRPAEGLTAAVMTVWLVIVTTLAPVPGRVVAYIARAALVAARTSALVGRGRVCPGARAEGVSEYEAPDGNDPYE